MSLTNTPVTKYLMVSLVTLSILASLLDIKHEFYILTDLHIWRYHQLWRFFVFQLVYHNSTEVLFGSMTLYCLRTVERLWGSRKFASFVLTTYVLTSLLIPTLYLFLLAPLSRGLLTYIPSGPTPLIFALLAQYHAMVPHLYQYRIVFPPLSLASSTTSHTPSSPGTPSPSPTPITLTLSDKSTQYVPTIHLLLSALPSSAVLAAAGWVVGYSHRLELLPPRITAWRVPGWVIASHRPLPPSRQFEGLQRRLEEEEGGGGGGEEQGTTSGAVRRGAQPGRRRGAEDGSGAGAGGRNMGQQILDQFRGAF